MPVVSTTAAETVWCMKTHRILATATLAVLATISVSSPGHAAVVKSATASGSTQNVRGTSSITLEQASPTVAIVTVSESMALKSKPFARNFSVNATWKLVATGCKGTTLNGPTMIPAQSGPFTVGPNATTSCVANQTVMVFSYFTNSSAAGSMSTSPGFAVNNSIKGLFRVELSPGSSIVSISTSTKIIEAVGTKVVSQATLAATKKL